MCKDDSNLKTNLSPDNELIKRDVFESQDEIDFYENTTKEQMYLMIMIMGTLTKIGGQSWLDSAKQIKGTISIK